MQPIQNGAPMAALVTYTSPSPCGRTFAYLEQYPIAAWDLENGSPVVPLLKPDPSDEDVNVCTWDRDTGLCYYEEHDGSRSVLTLEEFIATVVVRARKAGQTIYVNATPGVTAIADKFEAERTSANRTPPPPRPPVYRAPLHAA